MEEILKSIGWDKFYPDTLKRIIFFRDAFREIYSVDDISDDELNKCVALTFGIYGQGMVYEIYMKVNNKLDKSETLADAFTNFVYAFDENTFSSLKPNNYISLFIEYIYSLVIKNQ